jgi:integrase
MKMKREHLVPLSDHALEVLRRMQPQESGLVFPPLGASHSTMTYTLLQFLRVTLEGGRDKTIHGTRSTFRTWGQNETQFSHDALEFCLAHVEGSAAVQAYARGDMLEKRRQIMNAWAAYVSAAPAEVIVLQR